MVYKIFRLALHGPYNIEIFRIQIGRPTILMQTSWMRFFLLIYSYLFYILLSVDVIILETIQVSLLTGNENFNMNIKVIKTRFDQFAFRPNVQMVSKTLSPVAKTILYGRPILGQPLSPRYPTKSKVEFLKKKTPRIFSEKT